MSRLQIPQEANKRLAHLVKPLGQVRTWSAADGLKLGSRELCWRVDIVILVTIGKWISDVLREKINENKIFGFVRVREQKDVKSVHRTGPTYPGHVMKYGKYDEAAWARVIKEKSS